MRKEDLKDWTRDKLKEEIIRLDRENTDIQNSHIKLYNDMKEENEKLIECERSYILGKCCEDELPFSDNEPDVDALIYELQGRHQQDCIRINELTTTVNVLSGLYADLRTDVEMIDGRK